MNILLTGGAGYIGSHTAIALIEQGHKVSIVDNLCNSSAVVIDRIRELSGGNVAFFEADVCDYDGLTNICRQEQTEAVIHFAGLKAVGESVSEPLRYYQTNLSTSINLCRVINECRIDKLVFSSSATVYGEPSVVPISEQADAGKATNPYGRTKSMIEQIIRDVATASPQLKVALLRYFNPAGAHESGIIGEDPSGPPNNLIPYVSQVAVGKRSELVIFGDDYETADGTCIRDYIHISDLAKGHVAAIDKLSKSHGVHTYNLGTGKGYSVYEVIHAFERATNQHITRRVGPRREGDIPVSFTDPTLANRELGWHATLGIEDICRDAWRWQQLNPDGFRSL